MAIHIDVETAVEQRSLDQAGRTVVDAWTNFGAQSGEGFAKGLSGPLQGLSGVLGQLGTTGTVMTTVIAAVAGLENKLIDVGSQFEDMHRQLMTFSADTGSTFDDLNRRAAGMVGTLDTSVKNLGSTMAVLETRLRTGPSDALTELTRNVMELKDRVGEFSTSDLAGFFRFWGIGVNEASDALATLLGVTQRSGTSMAQLVQTLAATGPNLRELRLSSDQAAEVVGKLAADGLNASQAITLLSRAEKAAKDQHEDTATFIRNEIAIINQLRASHQDAKADEEEFLAFGLRNFPLTTAAAEDLVKVMDTMPGTFSKTTAEMQQTISKTQELHNAWTQFTNQVSQDLEGPGGRVVRGLTNYLNMMDHVLDKHKQLAKDDWVRLLLGSAGAALLGSNPPEPPTPPEPVWGASGQYSNVPPPPGIMGGGGEPPLPGAPNQPGTPGAPAPPAPDFLGGAGGWLTPPEQGGPNRPPLADQDKTKGPRLPGSPEIPYPAQYGQPPAPGETMEHWQRAQQIIKDEHDLAEAQARADQLKAERTHNDKITQDDITKAENEVLDRKERLLRDQLQADKPKAGEKAQVPYPGGYGAPPRPGETEQQYSAEQSYLGAQHRTAEALARYQQVQTQPGHTPEDLTSAENALTDARRQEWEAAMRLNEAMRKGSEAADDFGVKLDQDFGMSKGLPGLAENLIRFLGNLAFAPAFGAMAGAQAGLGDPGGKNSGFGVAGIIGNALGLGQQGGLPAGSMDSGGLPSLSYPGDPTSPADFASAGGRIGALYAFANSMVGTPYSQQLRNDCSGMVSRLANVALGLAPEVSFDTTSEGAYLLGHGFQSGIAPPGTSALQVGWNPQPGNAGHTAATLPGGMHAESGGSVGAFALGGPVGGESAQFSQHAFLPMGPGGVPGMGPGGVPGIGGLGGGGGTVPVFVTNMPSGGLPLGADNAPSGGAPGAPGPGTPRSSGYNWDALAAAEASGNWANTSDPKYSGGLQFDHDTWMAYRPPGAPDNPAQATKEQQIQAGENAVRARGGPQSLWPQNWRELDKPRAPSAGGAPGRPGGAVNIPQSPAEQAIRDGIVPSHPGVSMPPGYAAGGAVPIMAHEGEHVLTAGDVNKMGGQSGVYAFRQSLQGGTPPQQPAAPASPFAGLSQGPGATPEGGVQVGLLAGLGGAGGSPFAGLGQAGATPGGGFQAGMQAGLGFTGGPQPGPSMVGTIAPPAGYGPGFQVTGGGLVGLLESLPSTAAEGAVAAAAAGALYGGAIEDLPSYEGGGGVGSGASGSIMSAAINIGMQELNRSLSAAGQLGAVGVSALQQTFGLEQFGQTPLSQGSWFNRLVGGLMGAHPALPNMAGPKQAPGGLTPEQIAQFGGGTQQHQGSGAAAGPGTTHNGPIVHIENQYASNPRTTANVVGDHINQTYLAGSSAIAGSR